MLETNKSKMWLFIWALVVLMIICIWCKSRGIYQKINANKNVQIQQNIDIKTHEISKNIKVAKKQNSNINLKIVKNNHEILLFGTFKDKASFDNVFKFLKNISEKIQTRNIIFDDKINQEDENIKINILQNISYDFLNEYENGELEINKNQLLIKGEVLDETLKKEVNNRIKEYAKDFDIANKTKVIEAKTNSQILKKQLYNLLLTNTIEFGVGNNQILKNSLPLLEKITQTLKNHDDINIQILGHTDSDGDEAFNLKLSYERANAIKEYLIKQGIDEKRLTSQGFGEQKPKLPNTSEENKQKNRRVEFKIKGE